MMTSSLHDAHHINAIHMYDFDHLIPLKDSTFRQFDVVGCAIDARISNAVLEKYTHSSCELGLGFLSVEC